jgi:porin
MRTSILTLTVLALVSSPLSAQDSGSKGMFFGQPARLLMAPDETVATDSPEEAPVEMPWLIERTDYSGDLWVRPAMTGDWGGLRQRMMDNGVRLDLGLTQTFQGVRDGGLGNNSTYQGGLDIVLHVDTGKAGLWPGGILKAKGEVRYGRASNLNTGGLLPVNTDSFFPVPGEDIIALSELNFTQFLSEHVGVVFGKISPRETNVFSHDETTQFMNSAFVFNPIVGTTMPLAFLGAGVVVIPHEDVMLLTLVYDSEDSANHSGCDTAFDRGTSVNQTLEVKIRPGGLVGHQRVGWTWSDKVRVQFGRDSRLLARQAILARLGLGAAPQLARDDNDWSLMYDFDQYLYVVPGTEDQGIGLFGRFGLSKGTVNPVKAFYSVGVGGKGIIPGRENDTFGVGYYYLDHSNEFSRMIENRITDEQGVEIFYNIEVTPWLHITPDIQIINPMLERADTAVVAGVRVKIDF